MSNVYAVVDSGVVINIVLWDGKAKWEPETGTAVLTDGSVGVGWLYNNGGFIQPEITEEGGI